MEDILFVSNVEFSEMLEYQNIGIPINKTTFICGESGSGKSSLLKMLNGTVSPTRGDIFYNNKNIKNLDMLVLRKEVLLVAQSVYLFDGSIEENFPKFYEFRKQELISNEEMRKFLKVCCVGFELDSKCETMSGGEKQRVFIAICLSFMPKVIMLDEPTSALDETTSNCFFENIKSFSIENNITLVVVSHNRTLMEKYADNIIEIGRRAIA